MRIVASVDSRGNLLSLSDVSPAAVAADLPIDAWLGKPVWITAIPNDQARIRAAFAECLLTGRTQQLVIASTVGTALERWSMLLEKVDAYVAVRVTGTLLGDRPDVSTLTLRQRQLLWLMAHNVDHDEIVSALDSTPGAVRNEMTKLRKRLGLNDVALGLFAADSGLADAPYPETPTPHD